MKQFIKVFLHRGALFCGLGPVIMAIVYIFLSASGVVETVAVSKLIREIFTSTLMAFIRLQGLFRARCCCSIIC